MSSLDSRLERVADIERKLARSYEPSPRRWA